MINSLFTYQPIFISFADSITDGKESSRDLYCTAIARSIKTHKEVIIDCHQHLCAGGNYFLGDKEIPEEKIADIYINKEHVFPNTACTKKFLKRIERNPNSSSFLIFSPKVDNAQVVIAITNAANIGRLLGLQAYLSEFKVDVFSATTTCSCIFRPLIQKDCMHINFIDYFDRYHQAKGMFTDNEILVSMSYELYRKLQYVYEKSPQGSMKIHDVEIFTVDSLY